MDCAEACPLPDQEGCHPMKHCQPPWRRQSEPEISSEFRVQLRSEDPGRFSGAGSAAFFGMATCYAKACCPQRAGKSGQTEALWRIDVCNGAAVAQSAAGGSFFRLYRAGGAVRRKRCAGAFLDSGNFAGFRVSVHWIGIAAALGGQHPDRRSEKNGEGLYLPVPVMSVLYLGSCLFCW